MGPQVPWPTISSLPPPPPLWPLHLTRDLGPIGCRTHVCVLERREPPWSPPVCSYLAQVLQEGSHLAGPWGTWVSVLGPLMKWTRFELVGSS